MRKPSAGGNALVVHPDTPARAVSGVYFTCAWRNPGEWAFDFVVDAPHAALKLQAPVAPARADGLWQHTCFELFLRDPSDGAYLEFNLAPSGQWAAYQFDGYRAGMRDLQVNAPHISSSDGRQVELSWKAHMQHLGLDEGSIGRLGPLLKMPANPLVYFLTAHLEHPDLWRGIHCQAAVTAVIEEADGTKSYWALAHPPGKPDFHHVDGFALEL